MTACKYDGDGTWCQTHHERRGRHRADGPDLGVLLGLRHARRQVIAGVGKRADIAERIDAAIDFIELVAAGGQLPHTVRGETSAEGWPYGTTHDGDCPACLASGTPFTASPRSETYWSS